MDGVDLRRIETFDDHLAGLEIMLAADTCVAGTGCSQSVPCAKKTFERRMRRGAMQWLALLGGEPVAYAPAPIEALPDCISPVEQPSRRRAAAAVTGRSCVHAGTKR